MTQYEQKFRDILSAVDYLSQIYFTFSKRYSISFLDDNEIKKWVGKREIEFLAFLLKRRRIVDFLKVLRKCNFVFFYLQHINN